MKTIKEWLETLPEPYRSQALHNHIKDPYSDKFVNLDNLKEALLWAFAFEKTSQGIIYWIRYFASLKEEIISNKLSNKELAEKIWFEIKWIDQSNDSEIYDLIEQILNKHR